MSFTRRLFRSTPKVAPEPPTCPVPPPCPMYDLKAEKEKGVQEERRRILAFIYGIQNDTEDEPVEPEQTVEPVVHPDILLLQTARTENAMKLTKSEAKLFYNAFTNNNLDEFNKLMTAHRSKFLYENMKVIRQSVIPKLMFPSMLAMLIPSESMYKKLNESPAFDNTMKDLLKNVIDTKLFDKKGKDIGSIRALSKENNKMACAYFNRLFPVPTQGGTRKRRRTRRRKSRKH